MICSSCHKKVKDGTSICPHCDAVLDESILGALPPEGDDDTEDTPPPKPAPKKPVAKPSAKPSTGKRPAAVRKPAPVRAEEEPAEAEDEEPPARKQPLVQPPDGKYVSKYQQYWTEDDPPPKPTAKEPQSGEGVVAELGPVRGGHDPDLVDPMVTLKNLWKGFVESHFEDKMTIASSAMLIVCNFMPWREINDNDTLGDEMGLMTWGFTAFLLACIAITTVWARKTNFLPSLPRARFPLVTMGVGGLAALVCLISVITSFEHTKIGGQKVLLSPSFGVFLAIVAAAGIVVGGLLTLKRET